jgi:uncharacterized protein
MTREQNMRLARRFLAGISEGIDPQEIAAPFSADVQFEIAGDAGAFPWIGRRRGRGAICDFLSDLRRLVEIQRFDVQDVLTGDHRAALVGELVTKVIATGKTIESTFAIILTVADGGEIVRFQMLEDSFAVSRAAR